ncbi:MAG: hypothetical protein EXQ74_03485 [Thermoleophilia bacterium]|nr:hypothetical protein [Thermoleophilia bacterium]
MSPRMTTAAAVIGASLVLVITGVGCAGGPPETPDDPGTGNLRLTFVSAPGTPPTEATLSCPSGTSDARAACEQLASLTDPFAPVPTDTACTEIYGGPEQLDVSGTWQDQPVTATFTRTNGCEIQRWDATASVLVPLTR